MPVHDELLDIADDIDNIVPPDEPLALVPPKKAAFTAARQFSRDQARSLVTLYYQIQKLRQSARNKESAIERCATVSPTPELITSMKEDMARLERRAKRGLREFALGSPLGRWCLSLTGVGEVIAGGLLAHIDLERAVTAGAIWKFAGQLPRSDYVWPKGGKRPFNAQLKRLCYLLGLSFRYRAKQHPNFLYCKLYRERKAEEVRRNEAGLLELAARGRLYLAEREGWRISPEQRKTWAGGKLQPIGLDLHAIRYTVKIFLSHYHYVGRTLLTGTAPVPWILAHGQHAHFIPPPNLHVLREEGLWPYD